jgi:hypothetical protein
MSISNVNLTLTLRPLKLAFLVELSDVKALRTAIQANSFRWGGAFNPIVPVFGRKPQNWEELPVSRGKPAEIILGYLDAFDPDFIVPVGNCSSRKWDFVHRNMIQVNDVLPESGQDFGPKYGIGLFETLHHLYEKEFKFKRQEQLNVVLPKISNKHSLLLESFFGCVPTSINEIIKLDYTAKLQIQTPDVSIRNFYDYLPANFLFLQRISMQNIEALRRNRFRHNSCIFFLDATNTLDIMDYWNLRAIGMDVVPLPIQISTEQTALNLCEDLIEENYNLYKDAENILNNTMIIKSRSLSDQTLRKFEQSLKVQRIDKDHPKYMLEWVPRVWDLSGRESDDAECCTLIAESRQLEVTVAEDNYFHVQTLEPPNSSPIFFSGRPRFANEISLRFYTSLSDPLPGVIPQGSPIFRHSIGIVGGECRIGSGGTIYFPSRPNEEIAWLLPSAERLFISWLRSQQWHVGLSSSGLVAKQMLKQIGGIRGISFLARPGIVDFLIQFSGGKILQKEHVLGKLAEIVNEHKLDEDPKFILQHLTNREIIRLGLEIQCSVCQQRSLHSLDALDYEITCEKCLSKFRIPTHTPHELKWAYRAHGTFSLRNAAYGAYSVLLSLRFFATVLRGATTPILSFKAKKNDQSLEADLGLFYQEDFLERRRPELIFAECKSHNQFQRKDILRMQALAREFAGAVILFATLNSDLTKKEIALIKPLAAKARRDRFNGRLHNPVLVLTSTELFSDYSLYDAWGKKAGAHQELIRKHHLVKSLRHLCDLTQELYLDMPSWDEWARKQFDRRLLQRKKENSS